MTGEKTYSQRAEILRRRMEFLGFDQAGAAAELGWSVHQVQRFLNGKLKRARDIDVQETQFSRWLAKEENARGVRAPEHGYDEEAARPARPAARPALAVVGSDGAPVQTLSGLADLFGGEGALARLILHEISGFENEPRYRAGETVIAVKGAWPRPGEDCLVEEAGGLRLREYLGQKDGRVRVRSLDGEVSEDYPATGVSLHRVLGRANA